METPGWLLKREKPPVQRDPEVKENTEGLVCWWCTYELPHLPCLHIPVKYDDMRKQFTTIGNFCSWECTKAYAKDMKTARWAEISSFISMMRLNALGKYVPLFAAPKRETLKKFGGKLTIEEFRGCFGGPPPSIFFPNDIQIYHLLESKDNKLSTKASGNSDTKMKAIEDTEVRGGNLKLKRAKPLERSKSKLESTLGIIRKAK